MADTQFELLWNLPARSLEVPNRRGAGTSSVAVVDAGAWPLGATSGRVFLKRQRAFFCRPAWNAFRRTPTARREVRFLARARAIGVDAPTVAYYGEVGDRAILAVDEISGAVDFERVLAGASGETRDAIIRSVGAALATLHAARIVHGALYPKHILVGAGDPRRVALIDFEKGRVALTAARASARDLDRLARHAPFLSAHDWSLLREPDATR